MRLGYLIRVSFIAVFVTILYPSVSVADQVTVLPERTLIITQEPAIMKAAQTGFNSLLEVAKRRDFDRIFFAYGFDSPAQASNLSLGTPLIMKWIRIDRMREFDVEAGDPEKLPESTYFVLFPILSQDEVITSLTVGFFQEHSWKALKIGDKSIIRGLIKLEQYDKKSTSSFVVWVPSLRVHFLADYIAGQPKVFPIIDYPRFNMKAGQEIPVRDAVSQMQRSMPNTFAPGKRPLVQSPTATPSTKGGDR